jgi:hypothetical protein
MTLYTPAYRPYFNVLVTEDESEVVRVTKVQYPSALKMVVAQLVNYKLTNRDYSILSETVSRYSVTYNVGTDMTSGYPKALMSSLNRWRNPRYA